MNRQRQFGILVQSDADLLKFGVLRVRIDQLADHADFAAVKTVDNPDRVPDFERLDGAAFLRCVFVFGDDDFRFCADFRNGSTVRSDRRT